MTQKQRHITFAIPGAFATAAKIARAGLVGIGPVPAYQSGCTDAGALIMAVEAEGLAWVGALDQCAGQDGAPAPVRAHHARLRAVQMDIITTLGLDRSE